MAPSTGEWVSIHKTRIDDLPIMRKHDNGQGTFVDSFRASERYSDEEWEAMQDAMVQSLYSLIEIEKLVLQ
jgi:predicted SnoaL-like aldol condensation-catalyzing enzyme